MRLAMEEPGDPKLQSMFLKPIVLFRSQLHLIPVHNRFDSVRADGWHRVLVLEAGYPRNSWEATHISLFLCRGKKEESRFQPCSSER